MVFHQFLYLDKILSILVFKMKHISKFDYLKLQAEKVNKLFLSSKFDLVIEKSKKILEKNPKQVPFYNFLALSHREKGNFLLAEKILLNALKLFPIEQSLLINLGSTYRVLMEFEKQIDDELQEKLKEYYIFKCYDGLIEIQKCLFRQLKNMNWFLGNMISDFETDDNSFAEIIE